HFSNIQLDTCYNKFLSYNHLLLLPYSQTIKSFLHHIYSFDYSPDNSCGYTLIISIKNDYSEAHVYLLPEPKPLTNYFILPAQAIWHFPNIQLKSDTHNLSSDPFYNILYTPNLSNNTQPNIYLPIEETSTSIPYKPLQLSICTHNTRGY